MDENQISKVRTLNILFDSGASASIVNRDIVHKRHKCLNKGE